MAGWKSKINNSSTVELQHWRNERLSAFQLQEIVLKSDKIWCTYLVITCITLRTFWMTLVNDIPVILVIPACRYSRDNKLDHCIVSLSLATKPHAAKSHGCPHGSKHLCGQPLRMRLLSRVVRLWSSATKSHSPLSHMQLCHKLLCGQGLTVHEKTCFFFSSIAAIYFYAL